MTSRIGLQGDWWHIRPCCKIIRILGCFFSGRALTLQTNFKEWKLTAVWLHVACILAKSDSADTETETVDCRYTQSYDKAAFALSFHTLLTNMCVEEVGAKNQTSPNIWNQGYSNWLKWLSLSFPLFSCALAELNSQSLCFHIDWLQPASGCSVSQEAGNKS